MEKEKNKKWPTDNEEHHRWCEDCEIKYQGLRECPDCGGKNTFIDEPIIKVPKKSTPHH